MSQGNSDEQALRSSQQVVEATLDALPTHIAILDDSGTIVAVNKAWQRFGEANGYTEPDCGVGKNYLQICDKATGEWADEASSVARGLREIISGQREQLELVYPCHSADEQRWFILQATRFVQNQRVYVVTAHLGITEHKQIQEALHRSEAKYRTLVEQLPAATYTTALDNPGYTLYVSPQIETMLGFPLADWLANPKFWLDQLHPDDRASVLEEIIRMRRVGKMLPIDYRIFARDGRLVWLRDEAVVVRDSAGQPLFVQGVVIDITERKRAEEALRLYAERVKMLHEIDQAILAARSPVELVKAALNRLRQLVPCQRGGVVVIGSEGRRAIALVVDSNGEFWMEPKLQLSLEMLGGTQDTGATPQRLEFAPEPLIFDDPPPIIQALLADGVRSYMVLPLISQGVMIGALSVGAREVHVYTPEHLDIAHEVANSVAIAIQQARLHEQISDGRVRLRSLARRLVETQETERRQLAHELHDQVGQSLTALSIGLSIARKHLASESPAQIDARLEKSAQLIAETMTRIRDVMASLRPAVLDDYGLAAALRWYTQQFSERTSLKVTLQIDTDATGMRLAPEVETALFRMAQEALTNVVKHARSTRALVALEADEHRLQLTIADSGIGFDPTEPHPADERHGLGLIGMRERVEAVGGRLILTSAPGQGTRVMAEVRR